MKNLIYFLNKHFRFFAVLCLLFTFSSGSMWGMNSKYTIGDQVTTLVDGDYVAWGTSNSNLATSIASNWVYMNGTKADWLVLKVVKISSSYYLQNTADSKYVYSSATKKVAFDSSNKTAITLSTTSGRVNVVYNSTAGYYVLNSTGLRPYTSPAGTYPNAYLYKVNAFSVTYNANGATGGSVPTDNGNYLSGATVTCKSNSGTLTKTGFTFDGWNTKADGTGTTFSAVPTYGTFAITQDTVLYAKWTASGCSNYSFHFGTRSSTDWNDPADYCFEASTDDDGYSGVYYYLEDFELPAKPHYYLGWQGAWSDANAKSADADFSNLCFGLLRANSCVTNTLGTYSDGNNQGAIGTLRIKSGYTTASSNKHIDFIPAGYVLSLSENNGSTYSTTSLTAASSSLTETVWTTGITTVSSNLASSGKFFVDLATSSGHVWSPNISQVTATSSMGYKTNSGDYWGTGLSSGMRGKFRIWADNCNKNWNCHFVPYHRIIYHSNYPDGAGEGPADTYSVDVSVEETNSSISLASTPTAPTGYTFDGWYTAASGGTKRTGSQTISAGASADTELYAHWEAKSCTVTFDKNSGTDGDNSVTATYGEAMPAITPPTRTGYTFGGYYNSETDNNGTGTKYYNADGSSARNWDVNTTDGQTLYANWSAKSLTNYRTECGLDITVEGSVWLTSYAGVEVFTTNNPNNLITIDCDDFGSGTRLGVAYLLNGSPVTYTSSPFRLCWYNFTGKTNYNKVDADASAGSASPYRYYPLTSSEKTALGSSQTFAISYNPGAGVYNQEHTYTLRIAVLDGSGNDLGHKDLTLHGRALPQKFVIAANIGGQWRALPADLATSAGTAVQDAYPIQVDNESTPTTAIAPKTAIYSGYTRNNGAQHRGGIRLQTQVGDDKDGYLEAPRSNSETYLRRTTSSDGYGMQEWYLKAKTTNFGLYNISLDPACTLADGTTPITRYLCVYSNQIYWGAQSAKDFRILPVTEYVPVEVQVVEWKTDKIRFMYLGDPNNEAEVKINNVTKAATAELSTLKIDEGVYEMAVSDLTTNAYKQMHIIIKSSGTEVGRKAVNVPLMVSGTTTVSSAASGFTKGTQCPQMDLVVLSGAKLTADDATAYQFKTITVYGGGKLVVSASKGLTAKEAMNLRAGEVNVATKGATPSTSYIYTYPEVYIGSGATLTVPGNVINFDYLTNYDQYFGLALPYPVTINATTGIFYPDDIYGSAAKRGSFMLRAFDSKIRAASGAIDAVWVDVESGSTGSGGSIAAQASTVRGLGYTFLGVPRKPEINGTPTRQKYGIHRMKMNITNAATLATNENSNATIGVTPYSSEQPYNQGWWMLGNPYMANLSGAGVTGSSITVGYLTESDGVYDWASKAVRYVTVPNDDGSTTYDQRTVESYTFPAFKPFYVQVGTEGDVTFAYGSRAAAPRRFRNDDTPKEVNASVAMNTATFGDTAHVLIGDAFTDEYEIGDDLIKMEHPNVNLFTISGENELFANALSKQSALNGIPVGYIAPVAGKYVFSSVDRADNVWIKHLWLRDKESGAMTDLLDEDYEAELEAETNKTRFELVIELKDRTEVIEAIDETGEEEVERPTKFIWRDRLFILRNGNVFDATGKRVGEINK